MQTFITTTRLLSLLMILTLIGCHSQRISRDSNSPILQSVNFDTMSLGDSLVFNQAMKVSATDRTGNGIMGRKVIYRHHAELARLVEEGSGYIFVITCINRLGDPEYLRIDQENTTSQSQKALGIALEMISQYKFETDSIAPPYQCGILKLFIENAQR